MRNEEAGGVQGDLLTTTEAARLLRWSGQTLRAKRRAGIFREGEHFYQPPGCQPRWDRDALLSWLKSGATDVAAADEFALASKGGRQVL